MVISLLLFRLFMFILAAAILSAESGVDPEVIAVRSIGFSCNHSLPLFQSILDKSEFKHDGSIGSTMLFRKESFPKKLLVASMNTTVEPGVKFDTCFLYLDPYLLHNEQLVMKRFETAIESLYDIANEKEDRTEKPTLVIVFASMSQSHLQRLVRVVNAAESLFVQSRLGYLVTAAKIAEGLIEGQTKPEMPFHIQVIGLPASDTTINKSGIRAVSKILQRYTNDPSTEQDGLEEAGAAAAPALPTITVKRTESYYRDLLDPARDATKLNSSSSASLVSRLASLSVPRLLGRRRTAVSDRSLRGADLCLDLAGQVLTDSLVSINQAAETSLSLPIRPKLFASLIDGHITAAQARLRRRIAAAAASNRTSSPAAVVVGGQAVALAQARLARDLLLYFAPYYEDQIHFHLRQAMADFDSGSGDIAIGPRVVLERRALKTRLVRQFRRTARELTPAVCYGGPLSRARAALSQWWGGSSGSSSAEGAKDPLRFNAVFEAAELERLLEKHIVDAEDRFKAAGVLPLSGRRPVEVAVHTILEHPLNLRDAGQDVLTGPESGDALTYESAATDYLRSNSGVTASRARRVLKQQQADEGSSVVGRAWRRLFPTRLDKQSEWAREMLMLPLSVKDPSTPLHKRPGDGEESRGVRRRAEEWAARSEQMLRWDLPGMKEARGSGGGGKEAGRGTVRGGFWGKLVGSRKLVN